MPVTSLSLALLYFHHRTYHRLKWCEGCVCFCSFASVPSLRCQICEGSLCLVYPVGTWHMGLQRVFVDKGVSTPVNEWMNSMQFHSFNPACVIALVLWCKESRTFPPSSLGHPLHGDADGLRHGPSPQELIFWGCRASSKAHSAGRDRITGLAETRR